MDVEVDVLVDLDVDFDQLVDEAPQLLLPLGQVDAAVIVKAPDPVPMYSTFQVPGVGFMMVMAFVLKSYVAGPSPVAPLAPEGGLIVSTKFEEYFEVQGTALQPYWYPFGSVTSSTMGECPWITRGIGECPWITAPAEGAIARARSDTIERERRAILAERVFRPVPRPSLFAACRPCKRRLQRTHLVDI